MITLLKTIALALLYLSASESALAGKSKVIDPLYEVKYQQFIADQTATAEQGDAEAQYMLGMIYSFGEDAARDKPVATFWLQKAAEQGHVKAQRMLGFSPP